jgi:hypothetical protein
MPARARADSLSSERLVPRRPTLFRALGPHEPPASIEIGERTYRHVSTVKHDSWAATAMYADEGGCRIACKFNRMHPLGLLSMTWLGRRLALREQRVLESVKNLDGFPRWSGPVYRSGRRYWNAVAHDWIDGHTFKPWLPVDADFFPRLRALVAELHARDIAYVDMSKWENILIGDDGRSYLIDYQIHFRLPRGWPLRWWLRRLQAADRYYLRRHWARGRPDQLSAEERNLSAHVPVVVRVGEVLGSLWRAVRLLVLRAFGVRGDPRRDGS